MMYLVSRYHVVLEFSSPHTTLKHCVQFLVSPTLFPMLAQTIDTMQRLTLNSGTLKYAHMNDNVASPPKKNPSFPRRFASSGLIMYGIATVMTMPAVA